MLECDHITSHDLSNFSPFSNIIKGCLSSNVSRFKPSPTPYVSHSAIPFRKHSMNLQRILFHYQILSCHHQCISSTPHKKIMKTISSQVLQLRFYFLFVHSLDFVETLQGIRRFCMINNIIRNPTQGRRIHYLHCTTLTINPRTIW